MSLSHVPLLAAIVDVFRLNPSEYLSQNEIDAAALVRVDELNVQEQQRFTWPDSSLVARAYLDQLARSNAIRPDRARAVKTALDRADAAKDKTAASQLDALAAQLESDAAAASGHDAMRLRSLAATIKSRIAKLR